MKKFLLIIGLGLASANSLAGGGGGAMSGGATEYTQWLNKGELVKQLEEQTKMVSQQINMINNQVKNLQSLPDTVLSIGADKAKIKDTLQRLSSIYREGQNIARAGEDAYRYYKEMGNINVAEAIKNGNYPDLFYKWSQQNHDTVKGILKQNNMSMDWFKDQQTEVASYNQMLNSANGTVSALQAAGKIANAQLDSLNQLGQLQIAQNNVIASQAATQQSEKDLERAKIIQQKQVELVPQTGKTAEELRKELFK